MNEGWMETNAKQEKKKQWMEMKEICKVTWFPNLALAEYALSFNYIIHLFVLLDDDAVTIRMHMVRAYLFICSFSYCLQCDIFSLEHMHNLYGVIVLSPQDTFIPPFFPIIEP